MANSIIIKNIGEFNPEDGTIAVTFEQKGIQFCLLIPSSVAINEDVTAQRSYFLTTAKQYLKGESI